jgi:hypothetical protein
VKVSVREAAQQLEERGLLKRERNDHSERIIEFVGAVFGQKLPEDLVEFYRERVASIDGESALNPHWNPYVGWRSSGELVTMLLHSQAIPLFGDGCGSLYGLDLSSGADTPAVYFFDHEDEFNRPSWAAGSSLGAFLLLLADHWRAFDEGWPQGWQLKIDPDIDKCPRAPAIWNAG